VKKPLVTLMTLALLATAAEAESLFQRAARSARHDSAFSDLRARREGDLLTVIVRETHDIELGEDFDRSRSSSLDMKLSNFDVKPAAFNTLPAFSGSSSESFSGKADYDKSGKFEARLTVTVVDVLPNGNLVIAGKRVLRADGETKVIRVAGVVRPRDVTSSNTILSEQVANARVSFQGRGDVDRATRISPLDPLFFMIKSLLPF